MSREARPKGLIKQRGKYRWRRKRNGRVHERTIGTDYRSAAARARELNAEWESGRVQPGRVTMHHLVEKWLERGFSNSRCPKSVALAHQRARDYLLRYPWPRCVDQVARWDLEGYRAWLRTQRRRRRGGPLSEQTIHHLMSHARQFFSWAYVHKFIPRELDFSKLMPTIPERPPDRLTDAEANAVMSTPDPWGFCCRFLLGTGLRWSEAIRARMEDIRDGVLLIPEAKSGKPRKVPFPPELLAELSGRVGKIIHYRAKNGCALAHAVRRKSGVRGFHVHQCRHTFACWYLEAGGTLPGLQAILGHSTVRMVQRYAALSEGAVRAEAEAVFAEHPGGFLRSRVDQGMDLPAIGGRIIQMGK